MTKEIVRRNAMDLETIHLNVNVTAWMQSLVNGEKYAEPDPDFMMKSMMGKLLAAETAEEILADDPINGLQNVLPNVEGAGTGPIEIIGLYVAESNEATGYPTYVHITYVDLETGTEHRTTTGAGQIQMQLLQFVRIGAFPIRCQIKRLKATDQGGKHLLRMFPPD